ISDVLNLEQEAIWVREVQLRRAAGCAATVLHPEADVGLQWADRSLLVFPRRDAVRRQNLEHLIWIEFFHIQRNVIDGCRTWRRRAATARTSAACEHHKHDA